MARERDRDATQERERSVVAHAGRDDAHYHAAAEAGLAAEHFGDAGLRALWVAVSTLRDRGGRGAIRGADLRSLLRGADSTEAAIAALGTLRAVETATTEQTRGDAELVMRAAEVRATRSELRAALAALENEDADAGLRQARQAAARALACQAGPGAAEATRSVEPSLVRLYDRMRDPAARTLRVTGIPTGIRPIDERVRGLQAGKLSVVAARPGAGKSAFATTMLGNLIRSHSATGLMPPVLFFSLEMELDEVVQRIACGLSGVPERTALFGAMPDAASWTSIGDAFNAIYAARGLIEVETRTAWTASQLDHDIRRWHRRRWPKGAPRGAHGLVVIDYLQIVAGDDRRADERMQISEVSRAVTACAKDTGLAVLGLAQIGREAERDQRLPRCRDLKGSGQLEQDAYAVMFLHPIGEEQDALAGRDWRGSVLGVIDKVRGGGAKGIVPLHYRGECQFFSEWDRARHGNYEDVLATTVQPAARKRPKAAPVNGAAAPASSGPR